MKKYFAAAAAATVLSFASLTSAYAEDFDIVLKQTETGYAQYFGNAIGTSGAFTDVFTFSPSISSSDIIAQVTAYNFTADSGLSFSSVSLNGVSLFTPTGVNPAIGLSGTITVSDLTSLVLTVSGMSSGGGAYGGNINIKAISAVPEPATYGMMLGGLALVGFVARRRKAAPANTARVSMAA
jgi:hypothetical protein